MTKTAVVRSVCECQGRLGAELNEQGNTLRGWVVDPRRGNELSAPCHAMSPGQEYFQLAWLCPLCGRNTLRSFYRGGLRYSEPAGAAASAG